MLFTMSEIAATCRGEWDRGSTQRREAPSGRGSGRFPRVWGHVPLSVMAYLGLHGRADLVKLRGLHACSAVCHNMEWCQTHLTSAIAATSRPDSANDAAILSYCFSTRSRSCSSTVATAMPQRTVT